MPINCEGCHRSVRTPFLIVALLALLFVRELRKIGTHSHTQRREVLNVHQIAEFDQDKVWKHVPNITTDLHDHSVPLPEDPGQWVRYGRVQNWESSEPILLLLLLNRRVGMSPLRGSKEPSILRRLRMRCMSQGSRPLATVFHQCLKYNVHLELAVGMSLVAIEPTENW